MSERIVLRVGRHVGRTIYIQTGPEPSRDDQLVGVMDTVDLATEMVTRWNASNHEPVRPVEPFGLGAIVDASHHLGGPGRICAGRVVRADNAAEAVEPWRCASCGTWRSWTELQDPITVLSPGWEPPDA